MVKPVRWEVFKNWYGGKFGKMVKTNGKQVRAVEC